MSTRKEWQNDLRSSMDALSSSLDELHIDFREYCRAPFDEPTQNDVAATWSLGDAYDLKRDGWPILKDGQTVAYANYRGGTDGAKRTAEQMVRLLNSAQSEPANP